MKKNTKKTLFDLVVLGLVGWTLSKEEDAKREAYESGVQRGMDEEKRKNRLRQERENRDGI